MEFQDFLVFEHSVQATNDQEGLCRNLTGIFRTNSRLNYMGDCLADIFGPFSWENPQQKKNNNQNLGVSLGKPTLQESGLDKCCCMSS